MLPGSFDPVADPYRPACISEARAKRGNPWQACGASCSDTSLHDGETSRQKRRVTEREPLRSGA